MAALKAPTSGGITSSDQWRIYKPVLNSSANDILVFRSLCYIHKNCAKQHKENIHIIYIEILWSKGWKETRLCMSLSSPFTTSASRLKVHYGVSMCSLHSQYVKLVLSLHQENIVRYIYTSTDCYIRVFTFLRQGGTRKSWRFSMLVFFLFYHIYFITTAFFYFLVGDRSWSLLFKCETYFRIYKGTTYKLGGSGSQVNENFKWYIPPYSSTPVVKNEKHY